VSARPLRFHIRKILYAKVYAKSHDKKRPQANTKAKQKNKANSQNATKVRTCPSTLLRAQTTTTSAQVPLPIQRFWPSSTHPPVTW
jgi:hypothetical protein